MEDAGYIHEVCARTNLLPALQDPEIIEELSKEIKKNFGIDLSDLRTHGNKQKELANKKKSIIQEAKKKKKEEEEEALEKKRQAEEAAAIEEEAKAKMRKVMEEKAKEAEAKRKRRNSVAAKKYAAAKEAAAKERAKEEAAARAREEAAARAREEAAAKERAREEAAVKAREEAAAKMIARLNVNVEQQTLPQGWEEKVNPRSGRKYYVNHQTRKTQWERPPPAQQQAARKAGKWTCGVCTLENGTSARNCAVCGRARGAWSCTQFDQTNQRVCGSQNVSGSKFCVKCGARKDESRGMG